MAAFSFILGNLAAACAVQIRVSRMCPADIASVCKLRTDIFSPQLVSPGARYRKRRLIEESLSKRTAVFVAVAPPTLAAEIVGSDESVGDPLDGGSELIVGSIDMLAVAHSDARELCYITNACVHPLARRAGIGRQLVDAVEKESQKRGAAALALHVDASNAAAVELYRGLGFDENDDEDVAATLSTAQFVDPDQDPPELLMTKVLGSNTSKKRRAQTAGRRRNATRGAGFG